MIVIDPLSIVNMTLARSRADMPAQMPIMCNLRVLRKIPQRICGASSHPNRARMLHKPGWRSAAKLLTKDDAPPHGGELH